MCIYYYIFDWEMYFLRVEQKNDINIQHEKNLDGTVQIGPFNELFLTI